jgi:small subunit ribosomal protein S2
VTVRAKSRCAYDEEFPLANVLAKELIEAGVHFGHRASRWNPKMSPYIFGRRNLIHIIDVRETIRGLLRARKYLSQVASAGSLVLFVGTKKQGAETIQREAARCGMPYVSERWLGGTLTNFRTIRSRLARLEQLDELVATGKISIYSKKMQSALTREHRKMLRNLNGMRTLNRLPECLVIIDPRKEHNSVREARKLGVTTVALIDTDCDPDLVDLPIPGNDDSIRSIELVVRHLADAIIELVPPVRTNRDTHSRFQLTYGPQSCPIARAGERASSVASDKRSSKGRSERWPRFPRLP